ncbi:MAG: FHA domain-containing protein [Anaerolineales bacterium]
MENLGAYFLLALRLFMGVALYAFLGWCFLILWRDLRHQAASVAKQRVPALHLSLVGKNGVGESLRFTASEIIIGRHPSCEWMIADDTISARHARLAFHHDQWWLEDLGSRNGTFLNEQALSSPVVLAEHDQVRCGQVGFTIEFDGAPK